MRIYLAAYNLTAFVFWLLFVCSYVLSGFELTTANLILLNVAQGMAILEILHSALGWVKSPVGSTTAQVFSRILVLVCINLFITEYPSTLFNAGVAIVSFAWSVTELVRYSFYFLSLYNKQLKALLWMRYTFFIILYPLGVTGEWFILVAPVAHLGLRFDLYTIVLVVLAGSYLYYFPILYKYMWKQRKSKLV